MFAAGRAGAADANSSAASDERHGDEDWLQIGKSFGKPTAGDRSSGNLQLAKPRKEKRHKHHHRSKDDDRHGRKLKRRDESDGHSRGRTSDALVVHKKHHLKRKRHRRSRSESSRDSSTSDDEHGRRHRHRRRHRRDRSRSRSVSRRSKDAQLATVDIQPRNQDIAIVGRAESDEKLFEFDRAGDRDNRFFGSTYASDQPIYELGSRRNLLTGEWVVPVRRPPTHPRREQSRDPLQGRYFGTEARKLERSGQQKRLYLAYSEKRVARQRQDQASATSSEMSFIPLDPVINSEALLATEDSAEGETDASPGSVLLTDAQNTEQYLVSRAKALNASVAENPRDVDAWLDLIVFQEQSLLLSDKDKKARAAAHKAMIDKQAAILNRALAANPDSRELQRLRINLTLHAGLTNNTGAIDDFDTTQRLLEDLIDRDPTNKELWIKLIECHQQHFGNFTVLSIRNLFARIIAVLRKELEHSADQALTVQISALLVRFHALMCSFETKTGHTEHAIAQLQGLVDFTTKITRRSSRSSGIRPHQELIDEFVGMWSRNDPHFGEEGVLQDNDLKQLLEDGTLPQQSELSDLLELKFVTQIDSINPPDTIRSAEHKRLLLASSAAYQRRANRLKDSDDGIDRTNAETVNDGSDGGNGGRMVYSNLHGRRILVDDADDAEEYERILSELRGRESSIARQAQLAQKDDKRRTSFVATVTTLEDQRANYDRVAADDPFVSWLMDEERQEYSQWSPLWPARIDHQDLIEAEPERAVMTDEIQPFLFVVPPRFEWDVICTLLETCGVHLRHRRGHSLYADKAADCEVLAEPLFSSFEPRRYKPLSLSAQRRRELLSQELLATVRVQETTVCDRSKIAFIRHIFAQSLCRIESPSKAKESPPVQPSTIKQMWIGFEDEVAARSSSKEASLVFARSLSQHLLARQASTTETDIPVLFEYAKMESRLGNDRQVERIFEKTLQSVRNESNGLVDREFHRLVFLRARQEAWGSIPARRKRTAANLSRSRALYVLWSPWQSTHEPLEALVKSYRKDWEGLKRYLEQTVQVSLLEARYREELDDAIRLCVQHDHNSDMEASRESSTCVAGFCLHNLALLLYCSRGIEAATEAYRRALDNNASTKCLCLKSRWIWLSYLELIQQHQSHCAFPAVSPRQWRSAVGQAVEALPGDTLLLRLFVDAETGSTMSQPLRQHFFRVEKQWRRHFDSPELIEWLFTLLTEVARVERIASGGSGPEMDEAKDAGDSACCLSHRWGMNTPGIARIRAVFESMVSRVRTRGNALGWRLYLRFEVALGKVDAAKKIFYRALARAPWSKELYLDGIRLLRPYLNEVECQELVDFMAAKELHVRVEVIASMRICMGMITIAIRLVYGWWRGLELVMLAMAISGHKNSGRADPLDRLLPISSAARAGAGSILDDVFPEQKSYLRASELVQYGGNHSDERSAQAASRRGVSTNGVSSPPPPRSRRKRRVCHAIPLQSISPRHHPGSPVEQMPASPPARLARHKLIDANNPDLALLLWDSKHHRQELSREDSLFLLVHENVVRILESARLLRHSMLSYDQVMELEMTLESLRAIDFECQTPRRSRRSISTMLSRNVWLRQKAFCRPNTVEDVNQPTVIMRLPVPAQNTLLSEGRGGHRASTALPDFSREPRRRGKAWPAHGNGGATPLVVQSRSNASRRSSHDGIVASTASYLRDHCAAELANSPLSSVLRKRFGAEKLAILIQAHHERVLRVRIRHWIGQACWAQCQERVRVYCRLKCALLMMQRARRRFRTVVTRSWSQWTACIAEERAVEQFAAATTIQSWRRGVLGRRAAAAHTIELAATTIQAHWRGFYCRKMLTRMRRYAQFSLACLQIQRCYQRHVFRVQFAEFVREMQAARVVTRCVRRYAHKRSELRAWSRRLARYHAAISIQMWSRRIMKQVESDRIRRERSGAAIVVLIKFFRWSRFMHCFGMRVHRLFDNKTQAAVKLQTAYRAKRTRERFYAMKDRLEEQKRLEVLRDMWDNAYASTIQAWWRRRRAIRARNQASVETNEGQPAPDDEPQESISGSTPNLIE